MTKVYQVLLSDGQIAALKESIKPDIYMYEDMLETGGPQDKKAAKDYLPVLKGLLYTLEHDVEEIA